MTPSPRILLLIVLSLTAATASSADSLDRAFGEQQRIQNDAVRSQQRIDDLDDESRQMLDEYRAIQAELANLERYNHQMQRLVSAQTREVADLEQQGRELDDTRRLVLPLMLDMLDALEAFIAADQPFLPDERRLRLQGLRELLDDPAADLAEKYRRLLEAYRIEADYAYHIEAYTGELRLNGQPITVDYLRLGRTGLYWISLDGRRAGVWDARHDRWHSLDAADLGDIEQALRVARKQAPPELLRLPLPTPEREQKREQVREQEPES